VPSENRVGWTVEMTVPEDIIFCIDHSFAAAAAAGPLLRRRVGFNFRQGGIRLTRWARA